MAADQDLPETLGRYRVLSRIGSGGMAEVFLAKSTGAEGIEKILVVKRILPTFARSQKFIEMFKEEAKVAIQLNHPNIVQVYEFQEVRGQYLLAMEYVDGLDLGRLVSAARRRETRMKQGIAAYVVQEVAKGLDYAHNRKDEHGEPMEIVHRDVSPQNVLLSYEGTVKVADFGIAKARMVSEETGIIKGKFAYMSPEQARGEKVDRRSDTYALGVLLAELTMGRAMYMGQQGLQVLEEVRAGRLSYPRDVDPTVPVELDRIVRRATAFDREERFQTARSLAGALTQYLHMQDEVYDGHALERFISEMAPRERTSPDVPHRATVIGTAKTLASAVSIAAQRELRERRHVVVIAATIRSPSEGGPTSPGAGPDAARVLSEIAYKKDAVLTWPDGVGGAQLRFIIGLGKPTVNDPLEAVRLALDVLEALHGLSADLLVPLTASFGVSRGVVSTVRDAEGRLLRYEPVGGVIEIAEQLGKAADPSEVLVAGAIYRLVRRTFAFDEEVREVDVRTEPGTEARAVRAYLLRGVRTREERAAEVLAPAGGEGLLGRTEEISALAQAYQEVHATGRIGLVAVVGELGVGKSALVAKALEAMKPSPRVLRTECAFGTSDIPFAATTDLVREACGIPDSASNEEARLQLERSLGLLVPKRKRREAAIAGLLPLVSQVRRDRDREGAGEDRSRAIIEGVEILVASLAQQGPLLLWLDALQWVDLPTLEMMRVMMQRAYEIPLFVILATRSDPRIEPLLSGIPRVELQELDENDRRRLVRSRFADCQVPADIERAIVDRAGGNPFFLIELVDALLERGVVSIEGEGPDRRLVRRPGVPIALPTSLEGVIQARLGDLPEAQRRALRWLAVAGQALRADDLSAIAGEDLSGSVAELERHELIEKRPGGMVGFPSAVVRHVAYESLDADDRVRMHKRLADHLSKLSGVPPARIARHLEHGGDPVGAAKAYLDAADAAREVYSNREALRFYGRALALLPADSPHRFHAHEAREQIMRGMGRREERERELDMMRGYADHTGDPRITALAYNRLARYRLESLDTQGVDHLLKRAYSASKKAEDRGAEVEALRLTAALARELGDAPRALEACNQALERAGSAPELLAVRGSVRVEKGLALRHLGRLEEGLQLNAEAAVIFRRLGLKRNEAQALNYLGIALYSLGNYEDSVSMIRASLALDREIGDRFHLGRKLSNVGQGYAELGDVERALDFLSRALTVFGWVKDTLSRSDTLCAMAELLIEEKGEQELGRKQLDEAQELAEQTGDREVLTRVQLVRVVVEKSAGRLEKAEKHAHQAYDIAHDAGMVSLELLALACVAEIVAELGDPVEARRLAEQAREGIRARPVVERAERTWLKLARTFRMLGDEGRGTECLAEAVTLVNRRRDDIRDEELRARYLALSNVRSIHELGA